MTQAQDSSHPTGVVDVDGGRGGSALARARDRKANSALQMRVAGASWDEIAEVIGYPTARAALVATEKALEKELQAPESQQFMRQMAGRRLDRVLRSVYANAINPDHPDHLAYVDRVRQLVNEYSKLMGLNAPQEYIVSSPAQQELERWVARVTQVSMPTVEEDDIFDAEVVEDSAAPAE